MACKMILGAIWLLLLLLLITRTQGATFDVKNYGAKANGKTDDSKAINAAWKDACAASNASTVVISNGKYMISSLLFQGPCKATPITIQVQGTLTAPTTISSDVNSQGGWILFQNINGLHVLGSGTFDGQGTVAWSNNDCAKTGKCSEPSNIRLSKLSNSMFQDIKSLNSKFFHMTIINGNNLTLENVVIEAPESSLNTDGIHIGRSTGINITGGVIQTGDDCVSIGDGSQQINIEKVKCGPGHGISIGSLGRYQNEQPVIGVTVKNCTFTGTANGVRIKTWPASPSGIASNLHFEDLIMNNVGNPILIDQKYCPYAACQAKVPSRVKISNVSFKRIRGTSTNQLAVKLICSKGVPCQHVSVEDINLTYTGKEGNCTSECSNVKPQVSGTMVPAACVLKSS